MPNLQMMFSAMATEFLRNIPEEVIQQAIKQAKEQGISQKDIDEGMAYINNLNQSAHGKG